jgi:prepilin-type N-terminal cleavage/methylation domain-containing protein
MTELGHPSSVIALFRYQPQDSAYHTSGARCIVRPMRSGHTILEIIIVLVLLAIAAAIALPPIGRLLDAAAVNEAAERYVTAHHTARRLAGSRSTLARIELDSAASTATVTVRTSRTRWDTIETRPLGSPRLSASQRIITFAPSGIGFGLSNSRIVFRRGAAAETLTVSRTGRLRRQ